MQIRFIPLQLGNLIVDQKGPAVHALGRTSKHSPAGTAVIERPLVAFACESANACNDAGITDPAQELPALRRFADASERLRTATVAYNKLVAAHRRFAQMHDHEDPAHADYHQKTQDARQTLLGAEQDFCSALTDWRHCRGLEPVQAALPSLV